MKLQSRLLCLAVWYSWSTAECKMCALFLYWMRLSQPLFWHPQLKRSGPRSRPGIIQLILPTCLGVAIQFRNRHYLWILEWVRNGICVPVTISYIANPMTSDSRYKLLAVDTHFPARHFARPEVYILCVWEHFVRLIVLNMGLARICDSMLIELNMYLKRPLISTKKEFKISGSFWGSLYLEKTDPYFCGILEKNFIQS